MWLTLLDSDKENPRVSEDASELLNQDESALLEEREMPERVDGPIGSPVAPPISNDAIEVELLNGQEDTSAPPAQDESETEMEIDNLF